MENERVHIASDNWGIFLGDVQCKKTASNMV